ncbi:hypothetical protein CFN78_06790 [Amycolatopsis antarctica]|uniref:Phage portal protein n=1 Tax=Amycolatopsis antarctica TaxID=1854586 RepID=A0A263D739_9PSEU|nr:hypothetical protein [Amycolatopsis antarctica]OZM73989.1 hypothetical protein CFN78_06790 [Amycolatopsis antarctica]
MTPIRHRDLVLITPDSAWPPPGNDAMRPRWEAWRAWWSGDLEQLRTHTPRLVPGGYWERRAADATKRQMHLPLAGDIARTSAELLFGDSVRLDVADSGQEAWDALAANIGLTNSLVEAAEVDAAVGGVYLRPQWDSATAPHPLLTVVPAHEAHPQFRFGRLTSVTFESDLGERDGYVWRWLEHHEPGQIRHELWRGTTTNIGRLMSLADHPDTRLLAGDTGGVIDTTAIRRDGGLLVEYVPNDLPQPLSRFPHGRADIQGQETLLDALDETWDSWMRDLRLGRARLVVPSDYLDAVTPRERAGHVQTATDRFFGKRKGSTPTKAFDTDGEIFTPLGGLPPDSEGKTTGIEQVQFDLRVAEHSATALALVEQIVSRGGYAPQTFGLHVEGQLSGTAMARRERKSSATRNRKRQYWKPAVERCAETLALIDRVLFGGKVPDGRPVLEWPADQADPKETAETIDLLVRAEAMSVQTRVEMAHPEWRESEIAEEVARLQTERAATRAADPLTGYETPDQADGEDAQEDV